MRGGALSSSLFFPFREGPSPRARGSRRQGVSEGPSRRSIPACAGEPFYAAKLPSHRRVHPRVRGGAWYRRATAARCCGPSPRARGSHDVGGAMAINHRSIPACAGEPARRPPRRAGHRVHPRVRGGAFAPFITSARRPGPSPRARGSPTTGRDGGLVDGSIPACAGEPSA